MTSSMLNASTHQATSVGVLGTVAIRLLRFRAVVPDVRMRDGDTIGGLVVMHVPGHPAGSIALMRDDGWCSLETHY